MNSPSLDVKSNNNKYVGLFGLDGLFHFQKKGILWRVSLAISSITPGAFITISRKGAFVNEMGHFNFRKGLLCLDGPFPF